MFACYFCCFCCLFVSWPKLKGDERSWRLKPITKRKNSTPETSSFCYLYHKKNIFFFFKSVWLNVFAVPNSSPFLKRKPKRGKRDYSFSYLLNWLNQFHWWLYVSCQEYHVLTFPFAYNALTEISKLIASWLPISSSQSTTLC